MQGQASLKAQVKLPQISCRGAVERTALNNLSKGIKGFAPGVQSQDEVEVGVRPQHARLAVGGAALIEQQRPIWLQQGVQAVEHRS